MLISFILISVGGIILVSLLLRRESCDISDESLAIRREVYRLRVEIESLQIDMRSNLITRYNYWMTHDLKKMNKMTLILDSQVEQLEALTEGYCAVIDEWVKTDDID